MKTVKKTLAVAIASVGALCAANNAGAIQPSEIAGADTTLRPDVRLFIAGSSSQDNSLAASILGPVSTEEWETICDRNNTVTMSNQGTMPGNAQNAYFCQLSGAGITKTGLSDTNGGGEVRVLIYKRSTGGSAWGVGPVLNPSASDAVARLDPASCPGTPTVAAVPAAGTSRATPAHYQCVGTVNDTPEAGISDVEPALFYGPNLIPNVPEAPTTSGAPGTQPLVDDGGFNSPTVVRWEAITFGIQVTTNLRDDLQAVMIDEGILPAICTVGDETEKCMPSLSRAEIASLYGGGVQTWDDFMISGVSLPAANAALGRTNPTNLKINVVRRTPGSGTQAQFNALFFNAPCHGAAQTPLRDNTSFTSRLNNTTVYPPAAVFTNIGGATGCNGVSTSHACVHEAQGSGDVEAALSRLNASAITRWGLGINALERGFGGTKDYLRFVKVDGVAPTLANVANNKYYDWSAKSTLWRTKPYAGGVNNVPTIAQLNLLKVVAAIGTPNYYSSVLYTTPINYIDAANDAYARAPATDFTFGNLAFPDETANPALAAAFPFSPENPVMTVRRMVNGTRNTCSTAIIMDKAGL